MFTIGCHLSDKDGYLGMAKDAVSIDANTFQFFTRNPRGGAQKALDPQDLEDFKAYAPQHGIEVIMGYAPYTVNPASDKMSEHDFTMMVLAEDLARMEETPHMLYALQPGSALGQPVDVALGKVADALNDVVTPSQTTRLLLLTMAGSGTQVGSTFEQLAAILDKIELADHVGVCFDACRVWGAGYDIVGDLDGVVDEFDRVIGLDKLHAIHLNDSEDALGSHKDRHAPIGKGQIGLKALAALTNHPKLRDIPFYLEAPEPTLSKYGEAIEELRKAHDRA
ncbi:deoxyribonuclease IV [Eggerthella sinensis]|uniref:Probable endonuclease 4 n=1 Tax=Eggerthella sinensis TaxID=242230 RepID=A0A3N0J1P6_9ACTN|nr:deoxyribonuclease IV [Eggerthella sinensis]MCB7038487.1 deoxyribonuclease IV [Eggerthella sinensis]RDB69128.1 endonuclease IV [Eggerthella sinensis]RNM43149.1 endonuclease IV [Eggerthella sinensis]